MSAAQNNSRPSSPDVVRQFAEKHHHCDEKLVKQEKTIKDQEIRIKCLEEQYKVTPLRLDAPPAFDSHFYNVRWSTFLFLVDFLTFSKITYF